MTSERASAKALQDKSKKMPKATDEVTKTIDVNYHIEELLGPESIARVIEDYMDRMDAEVYRPDVIEVYFDYEDKTTTVHMWGKQ